MYFDVASRIIFKSVYPLNNKAANFFYENNYKNLCYKCQKLYPKKIFIRGKQKLKIGLYEYNFIFKTVTNELICLEARGFLGLSFKQLVLRLVSIEYFKYVNFYDTKKLITFISIRYITHVRCKLSLIKRYSIKQYQNTFITC